MSIKWENSKLWLENPKLQYCVPLLTSCARPEEENDLAESLSTGSSILLLSWIWTFGLVSKGPRVEESTQREELILLKTILATRSLKKIELDHLIFGKSCPPFLRA